MSLIQNNIKIEFDYPPPIVSKTQRKFASLKRCTTDRSTFMWLCLMYHCIIELKYLKKGTEEVLKISVCVWWRHGSNWWLLTRTRDVCCSPLLRRCRHHIFFYWIYVRWLLVVIQANNGPPDSAYWTVYFTDYRADGPGNKQFVLHRVENAF